MEIPLMAVTPSPFGYWYEVVLLTAVTIMPPSRCQGPVVSVRFALR
jgi:hypothetical protein